MFYRTLRTLSSIGAKTVNPAFQFIVDRIKLTGPMTVAEYMQTCSTSSNRGYYSRKEEILGQSGDFITAPECSQVFGELVAAWLAYEVGRLGQKDKPWNLVELGPGSGVMMSDILRSLTKLNFVQGLSVHMVETSAHLSDKQEALLCGHTTEKDSAVPPKNDSSPIKSQKSNRTTFGQDIFWYSDFKQVRGGFSMIISNEFFDALPIHVFRKMDSGIWREVLVDIDPESKDLKLRFVVSKKESIPQRMYLTPTVLKQMLTENPQLQTIEVSPRSGAVAQELAARITEHGGVVLIIDYGHIGEKADTFRAFKNHQLADPLVDCGLNDLTADVNFSYLKNLVKDTVTVCGPITQREFLHNMGIELRYQILKSKCQSDYEQKSLDHVFELLTSLKEMGERFKVMAFYPSVLQRFEKLPPPAGFPV